MSISWNIEVFDTLPSTQSLAVERAGAGAPEGTVIQSLEQTRGRGRHGNEWTSPIGNLYMSLVLRPACTPDLAGQVSFVAGLALSAAIAPYLAEGRKKTLKWPNDLLIDGKKCAGILLESDLGPGGLVETLIVGMGVNIHAPPPERVGLQQVAADNKRVAIHRFRDEVLACFSDFYEGWRANGFAPVRRDWLQQAHGLNHKMSVRLPERTEKGIFRDIGPDGALMIETPGGKFLAVRAGEVYSYS